MSTFEEHLAKARHNENFVERVRELGQEYLDWAVTGYFYASVHYIESYFARFLGCHSSEHAERLSRINKDSMLRPIYRAFRSLQDDSEEARYGVRTFTVEQIDSQIVPRLEIIKDRLRQKSQDYGGI